MADVSEEQLRETYKTTMIISFSLILSLFVYLGLSVFIKTTMKTEGEEVFKGFVPGFEQTDLLIALFFVLAFSTSAAIGFVKKMVLQNQSENPAQALQSSVVVGFALAESSAILGLVLFLISGRELEPFLLWLVGLGNMILHFPRLDSWREWLKRQD